MSFLHRGAEEALLDDAAAFHAFAVNLIQPSKLALIYLILFLMSSL